MQRILGSQPRTDQLMHDILASVVVFMVALPLCLGLAIASGLPPYAGIISGVIGGVLVGALSGCPLQVTGPANSVSVMVLALLQTCGTTMLGVVVALAGLIQVLMGLTRAGRWFRAVPPSIVHGMMSGIGVMIFASQFHIMLDDKPRGTTLENLLSIPQAVIACFVPAPGDYRHIAGLVGLFTIITLILWQNIPNKYLKLLPASLMAVIAGASLVALGKFDVQTVSLPDNLASSLKMIPLEGFLKIDWNILTEAMALALLASSETLLTAVAVDRLKQGHKTDYDRELKAQGAGNLLCGLLGVLPVTGVIVRSSVNITAGGQTRLSTILHGVWLLAAVVALPWLLRNMPLSCLAALLVYTGYRLVNLNVYKDLIRYGKFEVAIFFITFLTIVVAGLLPGVITGIVLSTGKLLFSLSRISIHTSHTGKRYVVRVRGVASFLTMPILAEHLEAVPGGSEIHVRLDEVGYIDHACLEFLHNWQTDHEHLGTTLEFDWGPAEHFIKAAGKDRVFHMDAGINREADTKLDADKETATCRSATGAGSGELNASGKCAGK